LAANFNVYDWAIKVIRRILIANPRLARLADRPIKLFSQFVLKGRSIFRGNMGSLFSYKSAFQQLKPSTPDTEALEGALGSSDEKSVKDLIKDLIESKNLLSAAKLLLCSEQDIGLSSKDFYRLVSGLRQRAYLETAARVLDLSLAANKGLLLAAERTIVSEARNLLSYSGSNIGLPHNRIISSANVVLHVVKNGLPDIQSGYTIRTHKIATSQIKLGFEVHVACQLGVDGVQRSANEIKTLDGVTYHYFEGPSVSLGVESWAKANVNRLFELALKIKPVALHAHSDFINARFAEEVSSAVGVPWVYEVRGFWEETLMAHLQKTYGWLDIELLKKSFGLPDAYSTRKTRETEVYGGAHALITLSKTMKSELVARGVSKEKIFIAPNAVDSVDFCPSSKSQSLLASLGISESATVIGYISSLSHYEGVDDLIRAYHSLDLSEKDSDTALVIVGDGLEYQALVDLKRDLGDITIHLVGRVDHGSIKDYYSIIDIFVIPRKPYDVCQLVPPLKPLEAMALEKSLIVSDVRALKELALDSGSVESFSAGDPESLSMALAELIGSPERRKVLGRAARTWVQENRSWEDNAQLYLDLYGRLSREHTH
jgi:glycosyltransferase involved in cell wall biosynthesis